MNFLDKIAIDVSKLHILGTMEQDGLTIDQAVEKLIAENPDINIGNTILAGNELKDEL